ncbi:MAG: NADPH-dependent 7-cyano-7-deazaguanine reductase QueF [Legionella sp.]
MDAIVNNSELGKKSIQDANYNPQRLFPISRRDKRLELGIDPDHLPFHGFDCWNHYEVSWLNHKGKPIVATAEVIYDCNSPFLIESKSLKLYFNSFNNTKFNDLDALIKIIIQDLQTSIKADVIVKINPLDDNKLHLSSGMQGESLDDLDIECSVYTVEPMYLKVGKNKVAETLCSDLLKSNCLVTNQPDWGSIQIDYQGYQINREGLLQYLVSFRNHNEFHEQCIERIFMDISRYCQPDVLTVYGRYTRRGGLDINPYRSNKILGQPCLNPRLVRQ